MKLATAARRGVVAVAVTVTHSLLPNRRKWPPKPKFWRPFATFREGLCALFARLDLRHRQHVEAAVQLLLGQLVTDQAAVDDRLPDGLALLEGLLGNLGGLLVADRRVQRRHDGRRGLGQLAQVLLVGDQAIDAL